MLSKVFGIISWFPNKQPDKDQRIERFENLCNRLNQLWPEIPILIIAQNWKEYNIQEKFPKFKFIIYNYETLGILNARKELRKKFLGLNYDYIIMFDDDALIIEDDEKAHIRYMEELDKHPQGFCFIKDPKRSKEDPYYPSQLNLCAISKYIYEKEDMVNIDAQKDQGFEDKLFSHLLHIKYSDKEFDAPPTIRCNHFRNKNEPLPSTWAGERKRNWRQMVDNTNKIAAYISKYKDLPPTLKPKSLSILVASCDKNEDLFYPFHYCVEKYWKNHPQIIYSTESSVNPYYQTITLNLPINKWTERVREAVKNISSTHIILMCDDVFLRKQVQEEKLNSLLDYFNIDTAAINLERQFDKNDIIISPTIAQRSQSGKYKTSVMCQVWEKSKLLQVLECSLNPWDFEQQGNNLGFNYLISREGDILDWGKYSGKNWKDWGLYQGKWAPSQKEFFDKEGLNIDYTKRGIADIS